MFQLIYTLRATDALGCARSFCYQMIRRISILDDSKFMVESSLNTHI